uniref:Uncharacterized protein n=1 Tax=Romanomermis culicivorax TaxID=13658 RepID=A0A915LB75_ROMCU
MNVLLFWILLISPFLIQVWTALIDPHQQLAPKDRCSKINNLYLDYIIITNQHFTIRKGTSIVYEMDDKLKNVPKSHRSIVQVEMESTPYYSVIEMMGERTTDEPEKIEAKNPLASVFRIMTKKQNETETQIIVIVISNVWHSATTKLINKPRPFYVVKVDHTNFYKATLIICSLAIECHFYSGHDHFLQPKDHDCWFNSEMACVHRRNDVHTLPIWKPKIRYKNFKMKLCPQIFGDEACAVEKCYENVKFCDNQTWGRWTRCNHKCRFQERRRNTTNQRCIAYEYRPCCIFKGNMSSGFSKVVASLSAADDRSTSDLVKSKPAASKAKAVIKFDSPTKNELSNVSKDLIKDVNNLKF